jgi:sugar O-acyltransferase (sialic acid O-acetyltransferase NeuD family)
MGRTIVFGNNLYAQTVYCFLTYDSPHEVAAFTVNEEYIEQETLLGLPVVPFEHVESLFPPSDYKMIISIGFQKRNRVREEKYLQAKVKGYDLITHVSSKATTWPTVTVGDNCIIPPNTYIGPFAKIGNSVIITPGVMVSHHVIIKDHCFIAPGATILGGVTVEPYCFIGANSTIKEGVTVARECIIGAGVTIQKSTEERDVYRASAPELYVKRYTLTTRLAGAGDT